MWATRASTIYADSPEKGWRPWGLLVPVVGFVMVALSTGVVPVALEHFNMVDANENPVSFLGLVAYLLLPFAALGVAVFAWVRFVERRPLATIGLTKARAVRTFVAGHAIGLAMAGGIVAAIWATGALSSGGFALAFRSPMSLVKIAILLAGFGLQSSVEEILFRGWMQSAIAYKFGIAAATVITSALFALMHYEPHQPWLFTLNVFLFGVFACCAALRSGNLWIAMGFHAGWNWLLAVGFELRVTGIDVHLPALIVKLTPRGPDFLTGGLQGPEGSMMCSLMLVVGIVVSAVPLRRTLSHEL